MRNEDAIPVIIGSIPEFCRMMELPPPGHPLVNVIRPDTIRQFPEDLPSVVVVNFFSVCLKTDCNMRFFLPGRLPSGEIKSEMQQQGWWLLIHPDLLMRCSVAKNIRQYGLFAKAGERVLCLAKQEGRLMADLLQDIEQNFVSFGGRCSQEAILEQVETLLCFARRFYRRQENN